MTCLGKDKMELKKMNKKGLIWQLVLIVLAIIGGWFLLKYFGVL
jgi:uncharacterized membrane protein